MNKIYMERYAELLDLMTIIRQYVNDPNHFISELSLELLEEAGRELDKIFYEMNK